MKLVSVPVPLIFQAESQECALACLAMVLGFHGRHVDLNELRQFQPGGQPLSLDQLCQLANEYGLASRALRGEPEELIEVPLPFIAHVDFDHYVVVERIHRKQIDIVDPARGRQSVSLAKFSQRFTGVVLELLPAMSFQRGGQVRNFSPVSFYKQLNPIGVAPLFAQLFALSFCVQIMALGLPFFSQLVIDEVINQRNTELLLVITAGFIGLYLVSGITQWFRNLVALHMGNRLAFIMSTGLTHHLLAQPIHFFARRSVGDLVSRTGSIQPLQQFLTEGANRMLIDSMMIIGTFIGICCYSLTAAAWVIAVTVLLIILSLVVYVPYRRHSNEGIMAAASTQTHFIESVQSIACIKRYEAEGMRLQQWQHRFAETLNAQLRAARTQSWFEIGRFLLSGAILIGVVSLAVGPITTGDLTLGMLFTLVAFCQHFSSAALSLSAEWQQFLMLSLHVQRLSDLIDQPREQRISLVSEPAVAVSIRSAGYEYPGSQTRLISALTVSASGNDKIAIVGPSGIGKSTLLKLIMGELGLTQGSIEINGRPITTAINVYPVTASLMQTDSLIADTISANIAFEADRPDPARLVRAAQLACIHNEILALPMSYQEPVGEMGERLSAGQRQRILIARCLYRQAPLLLLDECTSNLDALTARQVMQNILALPGVCFYVTHDPELASFAQKTIRLNETITSGAAQQYEAHVAAS